MNTLLDSIKFEFIANLASDRGWLSNHERILVNDDEFGFVNDCAYILTINGFDHTPDSSKNWRYFHNYRYCVIYSIAILTPYFIKGTLKKMDIDGTGDCQDIFDVRNPSVGFQLNPINLAQGDDRVLMSAGHEVTDDTLDMWIGTIPEFTKLFVHSGSIHSVACVAILEQDFIDIQNDSVCIMDYIDIQYLHQL